MKKGIVVYKLIFIVTALFIFDLWFIEELWAIYVISVFLCFICFIYEKNKNEYRYNITEWLGFLLFSFIPITCLTVIELILTDFFNVHWPIFLNYWR